MIMQLPNQIDIVSIARTANAAHYEYLDTVRKRTEEIRLDYFRKHAMSDPHKSKKEQQPDGGDAPADTVAADT